MEESIYGIFKLVEKFDEMILNLIWYINVEINIFCYKNNINLCWSYAMMMI